MTTRSAIFRWLLLGGLVVALAAPAHAQLGGLQGEVRDEEGKALAGVTIEFERLDLNQTFQATTDDKGRYIHAGLPAGSGVRYNVRLLQDGKQLYMLNNITVPLGEIRALDIDLKKERERQQQALTPEQKQQIKEMEEAREKVKSLKEHFALGMQHLEEKQYPAAVEELEAAKAIDPDQYAVWANLGRAYAAMNDSEKGIQAYEKAIEIKPDLGGLYNNLGQLYIAAGRTEDAIRAFEKAAALSPDQAGTFYFNLGVTFYNNGQLKAAVEPLRKATEIDPTRADAFYWLGVCLYSSAETRVEGGEVKTVLQPNTRESFQRYLELAPEGRYAADAKQYIQVIEATVPASVRVKK